ncbi:MAG: hypothetical protein J1E02_05460 [Coprobacter sp.]|nr:hypothetical protein [Coprobacter sp.]
MKNNHLNKLADNHIIIYLSISIFLAAVFFSYRFVGVKENTGSLFLNGKFSPFFCSAINVVVILLCALLLQRLNGIFALIRSRTSFPLLFFLLLEGSNPQLTCTLHPGNLLSLLFICTLFALFSSYQGKETQRQAFGLSLCIGCGFLLWNPFIYLLPVFWFGMYKMQSLTGKSFAATLMGIITVAWLVVNIRFLSGLPPYTFSAVLPGDYLHVSHPQKIFPYILLPVILGTISMVNNLYNNFNDKTRTRTYNGFINALSIVSVLLIVIDFHEAESCLPVLNTCIALQASHLFTNTRNKIIIVLFYIVLACFFALYLWSLFHH